MLYLLVRESLLLLGVRFLLHHGGPHQAGERRQKEAAAGMLWPDCPAAEQGDGPRGSSKREAPPPCPAHAPWRRLRGGAWLAFSSRGRWTGEGGDVATRSLLYTCLTAKCLCVGVSLLQ
jgi:hypothetical protein